MTTYTDAEVDAVALAIVNADRVDVGLCPHESLATVPTIAPLFRKRARAALAARDALFETVAERWDVITVGGVRWPCCTKKAAAYHRGRFKAQGHRSAYIAHVTTKRRKR